MPKRRRRSFHALKLATTSAQSMRCDSARNVTRSPSCPGSDELGGGRASAGRPRAARIPQRCATPSTTCTIGSRAPELTAHTAPDPARLEALGAPYLYYEQTLGGHSNDSDPELNARRWARHYAYLARRLMD